MSHRIDHVTTQFNAQVRRRRNIRTAIGLIGAALLAGASLVTLAGSWSVNSFSKSTVSVYGPATVTFTPTTTSLTVNYSITPKVDANLATYTVERSMTSDGSSPVALASNSSNLSVVDNSIPKSYFTDIIQATYTMCGVLNTGKLYCWGYNANGQVGDGTTAARNSPTAVSTSGALNGKVITQVAGGANHYCAIDSGGAAYCWGKGTSGQLGNNATADQYSPVAVTGLSGKTVVEIAGGWTHTCALTSDNKIYCWGFGTDGQLGNGLNTGSSVPVLVDQTGVLSGKTISRIQVGSQTSCAIDSAGQAYCWGANGAGTIGDGTTTSRNRPVAVTMGSIPGFSSISMGFNHTCGLSTDSKVYCWGANGDGQLGDGTNTQRLVPTAVKTSSGALSTTVGSTPTMSIIDVKAGGPASCAILRGITDFTTTSVVCWGKNDTLELGLPPTTASMNTPSDPQYTGALSGVISKIAVTGFVCALSTIGNIYCRGDNSAGALGNGTSGSPAQGYYTTSLPTVASCPTGSTVNADGTCSLKSATDYWYRVTYTIAASGITQRTGWIKGTTSP